MTPLKQMPLEDRWDRLDIALKEINGLHLMAAGLRPPPPTNVDLDAMASEIFLWANGAFPHREDSAMFLKMYEELAELMKAGDDPDKCGSEIADILIMVLDYAVRKGVQVGDALRNKMAVNRARSWERDELGFFKHVK